MSEQSSTSDEKYTATLVGAEEKTVELDLIQGLPQKSFTRKTTVDGDEVELTWELDTTAPDYTYRSEYYAEHSYS